MHGIKSYVDFWLQILLLLMFTISFFQCRKKSFQLLPEKCVANFINCAKIPFHFSLRPCLHKEQIDVKIVIWVDTVERDVQIESWAMQRVSP